MPVRNLFVSVFVYSPRRRRPDLVFLAEVIVFGLLFNIGLDVLARLMPQMQVFFVGLPLSILIGLLFLLLLLGSMMSFFLDYAGGVLHALTPHG
jgi:flagellar biosynthesis protein FliR